MGFPAESHPCIFITGMSLYAQIYMKIPYEIFIYIELIYNEFTKIIIGVRDLKQAVASGI